MFTFATLGGIVINTMALLHPKCLTCNRFAVEQEKNKNPNLVSWKPGQSGNPAGKKPGTRSFKSRLLEMAEREINFEDYDGKHIKTTLGEALTLTLYGKAVKNKDLNAIRMVMDHTEDKALTLKGDKENPLEINQTSDARSAIQSVLGLAAKARASSDSSEDEMDFLR